MPPYTLWLRPSDSNPPDLAFFFCFSLLFKSAFELTRSSPIFASSLLVSECLGEGEGEGDPEIKQGLGFCFFDRFDEIGDDTLLGFRTWYLPWAFIFALHP